MLIDIQCVRTSKATAPPHPSPLFPHPYLWWKSVAPLRGLVMEAALPIKHNTN